VLISFITIRGSKFQKSILLKRRANTTLSLDYASTLAGLPHFSWYNIPNRGKICKEKLEGSFFKKRVFNPTGKIHALLMLAPRPIPPRLKVYA
jgi:hypothetical protein